MISVLSCITGYQLTKVHQLKRGGGFGKLGDFFAENYISEQSANYVECGMCNTISYAT